MTEIILTSSLLILLLIFVRTLLRGKISPSVQYALWLLVAARLLIPGSLFTTPVSLIGAAQPLLSTLEDSLFPESTAPIYDTDTPDMPVTLLPDAVVDSGDTVTTYFPPQAAVPIVTRRINWLDVIWKSGMSVVGSTLLISNFVFYVNLRKKRQLITPSTLPFPCCTKVYQVSGLNTPCLLGLIRPAVYLDKTSLSQQELTHILVHESTHYRHGDHLWALLRCLCLTIHWYNPLVWWAAAVNQRDCELSCDAGAIRRLGEADRIPYGETLLRMVVPNHHPAHLLRTATTMSGGKRTMAERIALIAKRPRMLKITLAAIVLLTCGMAVFFFGGAAEPPETDTITQEPTDHTASWDTAIDIPSPSDDLTASSPPSYPEAIYTNALSLLDQYENGAPITDWLPTLSCFNWRALYDTREHWPADTDRCADILSAIAEFVASGESLTADQTRYILSATEGLDGAYSEGFGCIVYQLYEHSPVLFAHTVLNDLSLSNQQQVVDLFRFEEVMRGTRDIPMTQEETLHFLREIVDSDATALYTHSSGFFSLTLPSENCEITETSTGITITQNRESWTLRLLTQPSQWLSDHPSQALVLGTFDTNGTTQTYLLETADPTDPLTLQISDSFQLHVTASSISALIHNYLNTDLNRTIQYLPYLSWQNYREQFGESGLLALLTTLQSTADSVSLSWGQYHDLLSVPSDAAIDGAFAAMYQSMLQSLHDRDPQQFASVLLSQFISPTEQKNVLEWLNMDRDTLIREAP